MFLLIIVHHSDGDRTSTWCLKPCVGEKSAFFDLTGTFGACVLAPSGCLGVKNDPMVRKSMEECPVIFDDGFIVCGVFQEHPTHPKHLKNGIVVRNF